MSHGKYLLGEDLYICEFLPNYTTNFAAKCIDRLWNQGV